LLPNVVQVALACFVEEHETVFESSDVLNKPIKDEFMMQNELFVDQLNQEETLVS
jgi:hypothetical protein